MDYPYRNALPIAASASGAMTVYPAALECRIVRTEVRLQHACAIDHRRVVVEIHVVVCGSVGLHPVVQRSNAGHGTQRRLRDSTMYSVARDTVGVRSQASSVFAARKMSPVDQWQALNRSESSSAWVPLPTPGAPRRTKRRVRIGGRGLCGSVPARPLSQAARSN